MKLKSLARSFQIKGSKEVEVTGISSDSRTVAPGNLFIAKRGGTFDGAQFILQAIKAGAVAVVTDLYDPFLQVSQVIHPSPHLIEATLAARYYKEPSKELFVVGVTGTKGKTTTTYLIQHALGPACGLTSTVETVIGDHRVDSTLTTHDVIANQKVLREMVQRGCKEAVLEVSSHGLVQHRVDEISFDVGVFTNLYPDHLDYHLTLEEYAAAKRQLFERAKKGIFNADSPWASFMGRGLTFGIEQGEIRAENLQLGAERTQFCVQGVSFTMPLIGRFNVYNALAAIAVGLERGKTLQGLSASLATFGSVPARLQRMRNVFIDFAHTGDALANVLSTLKEIARGKVIVVFGCGGNRDPQRRVGMAKAADALADVSIITNDNPRKEDPQEIARQIVSEFRAPPLVELDRKKAIEMALRMARPEDLVLIAGKGHERMQIFSEQTIPFDDAEVVRNALRCV
ncbi:MAG: UDP-N-acetylmuramoyl-L-alanyl-D-glutamate--2,6-diaminopimelate ligase [Verrucomicrobia bacterium]|nr:UDP-N-acetylmuramoyl-L-alanyl-D-glutamate--2,6-diaminopimelate ligase [Verrucomicrobiota bacterium]MDE3046968.1 UDP-N-acetylmuramoyl-L-alanyl-D-glutamate--2,6-diaminopimelate ligase [Verrucomicrobiota bacterium]